MSDDTLLDDTLDDLADLPSQKPFPAGAHLAVVRLSKNDKKPGSYVANFKYISTEEYANPADADREDAPKADDEAAVFLHTRKKDGTPNTIGQGQLKVIAGPLGELFESKSLAEICEKSKPGVTVMIITKVKKGDGQYDDSMTVDKLVVA